jgi:hypothetical protein
MQRNAGGCVLQVHSLRARAAGHGNVRRAGKRNGNRVRPQLSGNSLRQRQRIAFFLESLLQCGSRIGAAVGWVQNYQVRSRCTGSRLGSAGRGSRYGRLGWRKHWPRGRLSQNSRSRQTWNAGGHSVLSSSRIPNPAHRWRGH